MPVCYRYDGTFAGFLTCVCDAVTYREEPIAFAVTGEDFSLWDEREVEADRDKARRVYAALAKQVSPAFQALVADGFLTCLKDRELILYGLICRGLREGDRVRRDLCDPSVAALMLALRKMATEVDHLKGFVRFSELDGALAGEIEPKNRVLPLLGPHFAFRFPGERIVLYDRTHREVLLCQGGRRVIVPAEGFTMGRAGETERAFRAMWRRYFDTVAIRERENPRCQNTHIPKRYRGVMTEFQPGENALPAHKGVDKSPKI